MAQDLTGLNSLRQALTPYEDVKFELNLNRHPKAHKNKSIVYAENMKLSKDGSVLENEESIEINQLINDTLNNYYNKNNYKIIHIIPCNTELVLFVKNNLLKVFDIWRYREQTNKYNEECALFYNKGILYNYGNFSGTFTYTSNDSLIIAFCEYNSSNKNIMNPMMTINLGTFTKGSINNNKIWNSSVGEFNDRELETYKLPICPEVSLPQITNISNVKGNSYIGTYYVYIRYKINKYDYTQWFNIGYPIINEYKQNTIIHKKDTINEKNKDENNINSSPGTNATTRTIKLESYVNQNVDLINNCLNIEISTNNILYEYCQIGFICVSKTYTKYYMSSDIKLNHVISISTNIDSLNEEIFNINLYENYYNVENIINKNNKIYISNYKTTNDINLNVDDITLSLYKSKIINNEYEGLDEYININGYNYNKESTLKYKFSTSEVYKNDNYEIYTFGIKYIKLAYYLYYIGKSSWVVSNRILYDGYSIIDINDAYIAVKSVTISGEVNNTGKDSVETLIYLIDQKSLDGLNVLNNPTTNYKNYVDSAISGNKASFKLNDVFNLNFIDNNTSDILKTIDLQTEINNLLLTDNIYPEDYDINKIYYNNTLDNKINNNILTGLCKGEVYDFYIHFIDKYGYITDGYKLKNKDIRFKYDFNNDRNPLDVCFITIEGNIFIVPSENKLFFKDENNNIGSTIRPSIIKKLNNNQISNGNNIITDTFIDTSFSTASIATRIINNTSGLKYLPENISLNLTFGDIFDEEPILYDNAIRFIPYYNSQNELFFKVPKLVSSEGDIQLGLKIEIGNIKDYGDYVSYFITHKKLEKTYTLNGFGTKDQLNNIILNNDFESGNIIKLYDITIDDWNIKKINKCVLQQDIINREYKCYTNLLNKLAYAQDSQNNRSDRQTTLYLSDSIVDFDGDRLEDYEPRSEWGVKYLEILNLNKDKYINNKKLYRLGNIEYGSAIIINGLNGKYDKHLAVKYGDKFEGVNTLSTNTGLNSFGNVYLYEIFGFFDYNDLGIYLNEKSKFKDIYSEEDGRFGENVYSKIGTDTFYEVITTLNLFNYKINNIYDTWINFYNVFDKDNDYLKEFNRTIYRSSVISDEGRVNNWRYFENDAYKNIEENKGNITNLLAIGNYLYVHTEHSLFAFSEDNTLSMNNQNLQVATPDIFDTEYKEVFITKLGYGGLQDKNAWVAGQFGYIWFDGDSKKIFKVYGNSMDIISNDIQEWLDNAYINTIKFANDIKNNRILIYFDVWDCDTNDVNVIISYNILSKSFISLHDFSWFKSYNTKNNLYYQYSDIIAKYNKDSYGKNLNDKKNYSVSFIINPYYREIKYLEHIIFKLMQRNIRDINNSFYVINDKINFPVEKDLLPLQPKSIRVYNDLVDTGIIECKSIDGNNGGMPKNNVENYQTPYWDLGNWNFSFLRDVEHYPNGDYGNPESRLFGNYFVISFDFGNVDTLIEFENLDVQLTKDKNL